MAVIGIVTAVSPSDEHNILLEEGRSQAVQEEALVDDTFLRQLQRRRDLQNKQLHPPACVRGSVPPSVVSNLVTHANEANSSPMTVAPDSLTYCVAGATQRNVKPPPPALSTATRQPGHAAPSSCRIRQMLTLCPHLQRFVPPSCAIRHCRGGSNTIIHRRPGSNQAWLSGRTTQRCGRTSVSCQLASLSRRHCNALCSTVSIALPTRESRPVWHSSSLPTGDKVSERTLPDGQSRVKLAKKLRCTNTPKHRSSD